MDLWNPPTDNARQEKYPLLLLPLTKGLRFLMLQTVSGGTNEGGRGLRRRAAGVDLFTVETGRFSGMNMDQLFTLFCCSFESGPWGSHTLSIFFPRAPCLGGLTQKPRVGHRIISNVQGVP